jgi:hypothetical protein
MSNARKSCHVKDSKTGATLRSPNTQITLKVREPIRVKLFVPRKPKRELEETAIRQNSFARKTGARTRNLTQRK